MKRRGQRETNVPWLLLLILILPVDPASISTSSPAEGSTADPGRVTLPDSTRRRTEASEAPRTTLDYSADLSHNSSSDTTDPPATTAGSENSTTLKPHDVTRRREADPTIAIRKEDERRKKEHDDIFFYDEWELRKWGLICALILCVIGILILMSGRCRGISCRRRQKQRYNVSGI